MKQGGLAPKLCPLRPRGGVGQLSDRDFRFWAPCLDIVKSLKTPQRWFLLESLGIFSLTGCSLGGHGPEPGSWQLPGSTSSFFHGQTWAPGLGNSFNLQPSLTPGLGGVRGRVKTSPDSSHGGQPCWVAGLSIQIVWIRGWEEAP